MKVYLLDEDKNNDDFYEEGLQNLMGILLNQYEKKGIINSSEYTILNYTGGYKSIIPMMTVVSLLEDVTLTYIYEESNTLLYLEELPIRWDWNTMESYSVLLDNRTLKDKGVYKYPIIKEIYIPFLLKNKLIKERSKGGFKMTSLGLSMKFYIEKNTFDAGSVLGHTMEYKLVDYYSPRKIFSRDVVIKGVNITTKNLLSKDFGLNNSNIKGNDIDVLIMNMDRGDYSILESKPLRKVIGSTPALNVFLTKTYKEVVKDYNTIFKDAVMDDSIRPDKQDTTKQFIAQMKLLKKYCNPHNEEGFLKQLPRKIIYSIHYQAPFEGTKESYEELINHLQFLYDGTTITDRMQSYKDFVDALFNQGKKETEKIQFEAQYVIVPRLGKTKFTPEARIKAKDIIPISLH